MKKYTTKQLDGICWVLATAVIVLIVFFVVSDARAGGTDVETNLGIDASSVNESPVNLDSSAYGFAYGMGDVDINEGPNCYGSEQWGTIIVGRQKNSLLVWCVANWYHAQRDFEMSSYVRCLLPIIAERFSDPGACQRHHAERAMAAYTPAEPPKAWIEHEEEEEEHAELLLQQQQMLIDLQAKIDSLERSRRTATRAVKKTGLLTEDQKRKLTEVLNE